MWAQIRFNKTTNPEAFLNASSGTFYLQVSLPANTTFYNVRTTDYRAYFLPLGTEVATLMNVQFTHAGLSQFIDGNNASYSFTHEEWVDTTPFYLPNTEGCPYSSHSCLEPQCGSESNLSPFGLWTLQVNPDAFQDITTIDGVVLQFNLYYEVLGGLVLPSLHPPTLAGHIPDDFVFFAGGDGSPQVPAQTCPTSSTSSSTVASTTTHP
jgi:hypothetical protein